MRFFTLFTFIVLSACTDELAQTTSTSNHLNSNDQHSNSDTDTQTLTETERTTADLDIGLNSFFDLCSDCHSLGTIDSPYYLGTTLQLEELINYIETDMPYSSPELCEGLCALDIASFIQTFLCEEETNSILCGAEDSVDPTQNATNISAKMAMGRVHFENECATCHNIHPDSTEQKNGADLFTNNALYYSATGLEKYIEINMPPEGYPNHESLSPSDCDANCANNVTLYIQYTFCSNNETYAFCDGYEPFEL